MKEYMKPEVEFINFTTEAITNGVGDGTTDVVSSDVENPWGN